MTVPPIEELSGKQLSARGSVRGECVWEAPILAPYVVLTMHERLQAEVV